MNDSPDIPLVVYAALLCSLVPLFQYRSEMRFCNDLQSLGICSITLTALVIVCFALAYYLVDRVLIRISPDVNFASKLLPEHILAHRSKDNTPKLQEKHDKVHISKNVDDALEELLAQVIDEFVLTWCIVVHKRLLMESLQVQWRTKRVGSDFSARRSPSNRHCTS